MILPAINVISDVNIALIIHYKVALIAMNLTMLFKIHQAYANARLVILLMKLKKNVPNVMLAVLSVITQQINVQFALKVHTKFIITNVLKYALMDM